EAVITRDRGRRDRLFHCPLSERIIVAPTPAALSDHGPADTFEVPSNPTRRIHAQPMSDENAGAALQQCLVLVSVPIGEGAMRELQHRVWAYVDDRKSAGWTPERVIMAVKQIAREAGLRPSSLVAKTNARITTTDELLVEIIGWCIHRYYSSN